LVAGLQLDLLVSYRWDELMLVLAPVATFKYQNMGGVHCSFQTTLSLTQFNSNYLVAMNNTQLSADISLYCGKKVIVSIKSQSSDLPLFMVMVASAAALVPQLPLPGMQQALLV
jgi:hypothetical protein